jgi:2-haloacid dehalogenase
MPNMTKPKLILLDVYETLLDMTDIERSVNHLMDSRRGYAIWFEVFMQYCFVDNCTGKFNNFMSIANATMHMCGKNLGVNVTDDDAEDVLNLLSQLPVHEGVPEGLSRLLDLGYRLAALTNVPKEIINERMERTGLVSYFEKVLSAETIRKYKPCTEVYTWAANEVELPVHDMLLVSAHGWDIAGAASAGMKTAYLEQKMQILYPLAPKPDIVCDDLDTLAIELQKVD